MQYIDFKLHVPIVDLTDLDNDEDNDSEAVAALFNVLSVTRPNETLYAIYNSFNDPRYAAPYSRMGRGDVMMFVSDADENVFISIDMYAEPTDQMGSVGIEIRAPQTDSPTIRMLLAEIRTAAEVASALLEGDLGLENRLSSVMERRGKACHYTQVFRKGELIYSPSS